MRKVHIARRGRLTVTALAALLAAGDWSGTNAMSLQSDSGDWSGSFDVTVRDTTAPTIDGHDDLSEIDEDVREPARVVLPSDDELGARSVPVWLGG